MLKYATIAVIILSGCASAVMDGLVGKDISEVVVQYGPPINQIEMPDGRTAFQWKMNSSYAMPTTTNIYGYGNYATATTYGGGIVSQSCYYTLYAAKNANNSYTVTGFEPPKMSCE